MHLPSIQEKNKQTKAKIHSSHFWLLLRSQCSFNKAVFVGWMGLQGKTEE